MNRGLKITAIIVSIILAGILFFFFWQDKQQAAKQRAGYEAMKDELRPLESEKRELTLQLDNLDKVHEWKLQGIASLVFLITDMNELIYTDIFPWMNEYGFTGVMVLSEESFPGRKGCISKEQFEELMDAGWKCCLQWEPEMELQAWMISSRQLARRAGIERPGEVYFPKNTYSSELDSQMVRQKFSVVVHHGEEGLPLVISEGGRGIWHPGAVEWNQEEASSKLSEAIAQKGSLVYTINLALLSEQYRDNIDDNPFSEIEGHCRMGELMVTDLSGAMEYYRDLENGHENIEKTYEEDKTQLEQQIEELGTEIDEIMEKYMG